jgi:VWFA-related protein
MMRRGIAIALLAAGCAAGIAAQEGATPGQQAAPEPPPAFPAAVEQVVVDVVVTDRSGKPVEGITRDDLVVKEDGVPQSIASFEAIALPGSPAAVAPPPPPRISVNTTPEVQRGGRTFVVVFDDTHITPYRARQAKAAVASFVESGVREGDYVTLVATSGGTWWTSRMNAGRDELVRAVQALEGRYVPDNSMERISEWEAMLIHVYRDRQTANRVHRRFRSYGVSTRRAADDDTNPTSLTSEDPFVTARASQVYYEARTRYQLTLDALERAARGLTTARGRKSIVLVSEGFIHDPSAEDFRDVAEACRRANAAIYFVDARGLEAMPAHMTAQFGPPVPQPDLGFVFAETKEAAGGSESVAADSGGFTVRNTNDLESAIGRIADETRVYYLIGYVPTNTARDGKFREIEVQLRKGSGKDLQIRARKGYYAPAPDGSRRVAATPGVDPVLQTVLDSPWAEDGIPLRMTDYVGAEKILGKAEVRVAAEVDIRGLHFEEVEGRHRGSFEFLLVVVHRESGEQLRFGQTVDMNLRPPTRERLNRLWFPVVREFDLPPGHHQARMVVREAKTGAVGSVAHDFEVPPLGPFRVSTPVITDVHQPGTAGPGLKPDVVARRAFPQGSDIVCLFEVFGAARDENGAPQVVQGHRVERSDGVVYLEMKESVIPPTPQGALSRLVGFSLRDAVPGDYEMRLTFRDEVSGEKIELREPFQVVPAEAAAGGPAASSR